MNNNDPRSRTGTTMHRLAVGAVMLTVALTAEASHVYRVTGSGSDDNTAALQAAFDAATTAGPGAVVELAGMIYTNAIHIEGFNGKVRGDDSNPPTIDVLRGLDPDLPGVTLHLASDGREGPKPLFEFVDSTVRMRGPLTFHISPPNPSDLHLHGPAEIPTTELGNIIRFAGTTGADIKGITMRGGAGSIDDFGGSWNVRVGIAFFTSEPFPFGVPTHGFVRVTKSNLENLLITVSSDSLVNANVEVSKSTLRNCAFCLILSNSSGAEARYAHNTLADIRGFGLLALQLNEPGVGESVPISAPTSIKLYRNVMQVAAGGVAGLQVIDESRLRFGVKTVDLTVAGNDISGGGVGAALAIAVQDYRVIGNRIVGDWFLGVDAFLGSDDCTILGNTFGRSRRVAQEGVSAPGGVVSVSGSMNCDVLLNRFVDVTGTAVNVDGDARFNRIRFNNYRRSGIPECAIRLQGDNNAVTEHAFPKGTDASIQVCDTGAGNVVH